MKPNYLEPCWSKDPPLFYRKEVVVSLPFQLNGEKMKKNITKETSVREMRGLDRIPGDVILMFREDMTAASLYRLVHDHYGELGTVRFTGECLADDNSDLIREFSKYASKQSEDVFRVIIETGFSVDESMDNLSSLLNIDGVGDKTSLIDDIVIKIKIPEGVENIWIEEKLQKIAEGIVSCMSATGMGLRTVTMGLIVDENSSMESFSKLIKMIKEVCKMDDRYPDLDVLAFDSINFCFFPVIESKSIVSFLSNATDILVENDFDLTNIMVAPVSSIAEDQ